MICGVYDKSYRTWTRQNSKASVRDFLWFIPANCLLACSTTIILPGTQVFFHLNAILIFVIKVNRKNIQPEYSNLDLFTPIKTRLNELFPAFDSNPRVCESVFTFVREIKLVLHNCTLKSSFYNFI